MADTYAAAFAVSLAAALVASPAARRLALRFGALDMPASRKGHFEPVPYFGGLAIVLAFAVAASVAFVGRAEPPPKFAAILAGAVVVAAIGLLDDLRSLPYWVKFAVEILAAVALYSADVRTHLFGDVWPLDFVLTIGWIVGITNAVNYMDNMDALSAGVSVIAAAYFCALAADSGQFVVASLCAALAGSALGFLWHNRPPARIFMGDAGSLFLGFLLAALGLELRFDNIARVTFFVPVAVMAVPILDALMVSVARLREGRPVLRAGRDHISHRLVRVGIPPKAAVGLLYLAAAASGWLGVVIAYAQPRTAYMLMGWLVAIGVFLSWLLLRVDTETDSASGRRST